MEKSSLLRPKKYSNLAKTCLISAGLFLGINAVSGCKTVRQDIARDLFMRSIVRSVAEEGVKKAMNSEDYQENKKQNYNQKNENRSYNQKEKKQGEKRISYLPLEKRKIIETIKKMPKLIHTGEDTNKDDYPDWIYIDKDGNQYPAVRIFKDKSGGNYPEKIGRFKKTCFEYYTASGSESLRPVPKNTLIIWYGDPKLGIW